MGSFTRVELSFKLFPWQIFSWPTYLKRSLFIGAGFLLSSLVFLSDSPSFSIIYLIWVISSSSVISNFFKFSTTLSTGFSIGFSTTLSTGFSIGFSGTIGWNFLGMKPLAGNFKAEFTTAHGLVAETGGWGCPTAIFCTL